MLRLLTELGSTPTGYMAPALQELLSIRTTLAGVCQGMSNGNRQAEATRRQHKPERTPLPAKAPLLKGLDLRFKGLGFRV